MSAIHVTLFSDKYLTEIEDLIKQFPDIFSKKDYEVYRNELLGYLLKLHSTHKQQQIIVLLNDETPIGMIMYSYIELTENYYKINWLLVSKLHQKKGYGKLLLNFACEKIKEHGGKHIYLETSNEHHNTSVKTFYEKCGFKPLGVLPDYYPHPIGRKQREDNIIYFKTF